MDKHLVGCIILLILVCSPFSEAEFVNAADEREPAAAVTSEIASPEGGTKPKDIQNIIQGAELGDAKDQFELAIMYATGDRLKKDDALSADWLRRAADQGMPEAQLLLGAAYDGGVGVDPDHGEAAKWIRRAAAQGLAEAQMALAERYARGLGVPKDREVAADWLRKAADQGLAEAERCLGIAYLSGDGVRKSKKQAAKWLEKAAKQGDAIAQTRLSLLYVLGQGVRKDPVKAEKLALMAAKQGLADAQHLMGMLRDDGIGVSVDYTEAASWYRRAAEQGHARAQTDLGLMYAEGLGVEKNFVEAFKWFSLAAGAGVQQAFEQGILIGVQLSPEERDHATRMAQEWLAEKSEGLEETPELQMDAVAGCASAVGEWLNDAMYTYALPYERVYSEAMGVLMTPNNFGGPLARQTWQVIDSNKQEGWIKAHTQPVELEHDGDEMTSGLITVQLVRVGNLIRVDVTSSYDKCPWIDWNQGNIKDFVGRLNGQIPAELFRRNPAHARCGVDVVCSLPEVKPE